MNAGTQGKTICPASSLAYRWEAGRGDTPTGRHLRVLMAEKRGALPSNCVHYMCASLGLLLEPDPASSCMGGRSKGFHFTTQSWSPTMLGFVLEENKSGRERWRKRGTDRDKDLLAERDVIKWGRQKRGHRMDKVRRKMRRSKTGSGECLRTRPSSTLPRNPRWLAPSPSPFPVTHPRSLAPWCAPSSVGVFLSGLAGPSLLHPKLCLVTGGVASMSRQNCHSHSLPRLETSPAAQGSQCLLWCQSTGEGTAKESQRVKWKHGVSPGFTALGVPKWRLDWDNRQQLFPVCSLNSEQWPNQFTQHGKSTKALNLNAALGPSTTHRV